MLWLLSKYTLDDMRRITVNVGDCPRIKPRVPGLSCQCSDNLATTTSPLSIFSFTLPGCHSSVVNGSSSQISSDYHFTSLLHSPLTCRYLQGLLMWHEILSLIPRPSRPGNEARKQDNVLVSQFCTYQAPANSISSWEYLPSSGSLGGGPFTTAFSCSKIVVHFPQGKVPSVSSSCMGGMK